MLPLQRLHQLLPASRLAQLAVEYHTDKKNTVRLPGTTVFLCLLHGLLHHEEITQRLLEEIYTEYTGTHADHSSFAARLKVIPPTYFEALFLELYQKLAPKTTTRGETQALRLRFVDATTVTLSAKLLHFGLWARNRTPDKARRAVKSVWELTQDRLPHLLHLCTDKRENADSVALGETMQHHAKAGDLFVFDKGCEARQRLLDLHQAGAFFLTPHGQQGVRIDRLLLEVAPDAWPAQAPDKDAPDFVLVKVEQAVFENSRPSKQWEGMPLLLLSGLRFDARTKQWKPVCFMTNLPLSEDGQGAGAFSFWEVCDLYRQRWDIEVFFKFLKQHLSMSHLLSRCENGIRVMLYMSLIAAWLLIWFQRETKIDRGWRSVKFWFAHDVREWTQQSLREAWKPPKT